MPPLFVYFQCIQLFYRKIVDFRGIPKNTKDGSTLFCFSLSCSALKLIILTETYFCLGWELNLDKLWWKLPLWRVHSRPHNPALCNLFRGWNGGKGFVKVSIEVERSNHETCSNLFLKIWLPSGKNIIRTTKDLVCAKNNLGMEGLLTAFYLSNPIKLLNLGTAKCSSQILWTYSLFTEHVIVISHFGSITYKFKS